ncbi:Helix-turn-helix domain-containing protein [Roseivivax lentus]|uniref:Helix-turn-helix domain-containing protein n=1 Tax=Roseivivax lentus TaxID=633194 RepID=A0A1N7Q6A9_9RHOB|nr:helix-turn-helix domain-containing protein [Roseivivax lentus]SIT18383.1 Helix-turn-helix domain-containing protein [Roseivivax lentus]
MQTYLTLEDVSIKLGNRSRSSIYKDIEAGRLPKPMKLGARIYWPEDELEAHLREQRGSGAA